MSFAEQTRLVQIEIAILPDGALHVFAESVNEVLKDGLVIASTTHRDSFAADSDAGQAVLGQALAITTASAHALTTQRDQLVATLTDANQQIARLQSELAAAHQANG